MILVCAEISCPLVVDEHGVRYAKLGEGICARVLEAKRGGDVIHYIHYGGVDMVLSHPHLSDAKEAATQASKDVEGYEQAFSFTMPMHESLSGLWDKIRRDMEDEPPPTDEKLDLEGFKFDEMDRPPDLPRDTEEQIFIADAIKWVFNLRASFSPYLTFEADTKGALTRLLRAARQGQVETMDFIHKELCNWGHNEDLDSTRVIHSACIIGLKVVVEYMVKTFGISILEKSTSDGIQPIHCACFYGSIELVKYILNLVPRCLEAATSQGIRPLHLAAMLPQGTETLRYLLNRGANPVARDQAENLPLHYAALFGIPSTLRELLQHTPVNVTGAAGLQPIHLAAAYGRQANFKFLLQNGASIHARTPSGLEPLIFAAPNFMIFGLKDLLRLGANVNTRTQNGATPLHFAVRTMPVPVLDLLFDNGAVLNLKDDKGAEPIHEAAAAGNLDAVKWLFARNSVRLDCVDQHGYQPLHKAVESGQYHVVEWLLTQGVSLAARCEGNKTVLHLASAHGKVQVLQLLLKRGGKADLNAKDVDGRTPLHVAAMNSNHTLVTALTAAGADTAIKDKQHKTARELFPHGSSDQLDMTDALRKILLPHMGGSV